MIDITSNLEAIEKVMALMEKYHVDEVSIDYLNIKKSKFKGEKAVVSDEALLAKHLETSPTDPWDSLPPEAIEAWARTGKI